MAARTLLSALLFLAVLGYGEGLGAQLRKEGETTQIACDVCKEAYDEFKEFLKENSKEILQFLDEFCSELPGDLNKTCRSVVDEYGPLIIDTLENLDAQEVCEYLGFCTAVTESDVPQDPIGRVMCFVRKSLRSNLNKMMIRRAFGQGFLCDTCDEIVSMLHEVLTDQQLLDEIAGLMAEGCAVTPMEEKCGNFFLNLPGQIMQLANEYLRNETCNDVGFCQSAVPMTIDRFFDGIVPDDFFSGLPRRNPRPRPDTEPFPRPHPWRGHSKHTHPDRTHPKHTYPNPKHTYPNPIHHTTDREHHSRDWNRPIIPPHYRGPPHSGLYDHLFRPRPWWTSGKDRKPYKPDTPDEPASEMPGTEVPIPEVTEIPTLDFEPIAQRDGLRLDPEDPFNIRRERLPKHGFEPRKDASPVKSIRPANGRRTFPRGFGSRKQRSVTINTVVNTGGFDATNTYEVDPGNEETEAASWKCDLCLHEVNALRGYLTEHKDVITQKLETIADMICDRLPSTTAAQCKDEVTEILPTVVDLILEYYLTANRVCTALNVC